MKFGPLLLATIILASAAVALTSCDDDSGSGADFIGTWVREQTSSSPPFRDRWTLTLNEDDTYKLIHEHTSNDGTTPLTGISSRQGTYDITSDGYITIDGDWLDMTSEISALSDLGDNFYTFTQATMIAYDSQRDVLFFGPDFNEGSYYAQSDWEFGEDNYSLLFNVGSSQYERQSEMILQDTGGNVIEQRQETFTYEITDNSGNCTGTYTASVTLNGDTDQISGTMDNCTYVQDTDVEVEAIGGGTTQVSTVAFYYQRDGQSVDETFMKVGDVFVSFEVGDHLKRIVNGAFIRSAQ